MVLINVVDDQLLSVKVLMLRTRRVHQCRIYDDKAELMHVFLLALLYEPSNHHSDIMPPR